MLWFRRLNLAALALCFVVVVLGAYVRLSHAGLGCPDWPGCYGRIVVPEAPHEVAAAQALYPQRPLEAPKAWKEMIHRYLASTIVAMAVVSAVRRERDLPRRLPWVLVALVVFQGILGMWTVTWQLKPLAVSGHLLGGLSTLSLLLWMWLAGRAPAAAGADDPRTERRAWMQLQSAAAGRRRPAGLRPLAAAALLLLAGQIFLGGWTSSNYAALACPDLPTCHGRWLPETDAAEAFTLWRGLGVNYEFGVLDNRARVTIHFFHRLGAVLVAAAVLGLAVYLRRTPHGHAWRRLGGVLLGALGLQLALGVSIVLLQLPLALAAAHNAGAALLLAGVVAVNYYAWNPPDRA
ncbi:MAG: COX15/CtaA family protein [Gammaproteobacteria bacterium]|nr:COX15/CtaA family protein [Gammaproteobacteria bacterium]